VKGRKDYIHLFGISLIFFILSLISIVFNSFESLRNIIFKYIDPFTVNIFMNFMFLYFIGLLLFTFYRLKKVEMEKRKLKDEVLLKIRDEIARYVAPPTMEIVEKIATGKKVDTGEIVNVTILFSDIRGFTQIGENMNPDELFKVLNLCLSIQIQIVEKYHGIIDKLNGDEIMAVFHGPEATENALNCALEIIKNLRNPEFKMERDWIGVGIGINTGPAYLGPLGSESRKQFTLVGNTVNVAARLCGIAKKFEILFGNNTEELIKDKDFNYEFLGKVSLKGLSAPFEVFRLRNNEVANLF